jgi:hypothetical protein
MPRHDREAAGASGIYIEIFRESKKYFRDGLEIGFH